MWMKNLWYFTRKSNKRRNLLPFPSYVCISFANPGMTRRIHQQHDLAVRVIGRCVEALVVNKFRADINSRNVPVSEDDPELAPLSTILGSETHDVMLLLRHPGAIEFTTMVFLALDNFYSFTHETVPSDSEIPYVVRKTFRKLSRALPESCPESGIMIPLDQTVVDGQCEPVL